VGAIAVGVLRINYLSAVGVLAGSMTDPPALAFANSLTSTAAPALSYAAVYPLTMVLRVLAAQVLVLLLV
jgi:putative transport protein